MTAILFAPIALAVLTATAALHAADSSTAPQPAVTTWKNGQSTVISRITFGTFTGTPAEIGEQSGHLWATNAKHMLNGIQSHAAPAVLDRLAKDIPEGDRAELAALAAAAGLDADALIRANLVLDCGCSSPDDARGRCLRSLVNPDWAQ